MSNSNFYNSAAFKALVAGIEQQYGLVQYVTSCNHPEVPDHDILEDNEVLEIAYPTFPEDNLVTCCSCQIAQPKSICRYINERIGPDLFPIEEWICEICDEDEEGA